MKVLRLHGVGDVRLHDEPMPEPNPDEELVCVTSVGVCGSDLHWLTDAGIGDARLERPLVLGHEFAGEIVSGPRRGLRVAVDPTIQCGVCEHCRQGNPNFCVQIRFAGHGLEDGAMREYIAWPEKCLYPLPNELSDIDGAMLEPLGVAIHAVDLGHLKPGMTVGVFGCGPVGLLTMQVALLTGPVAVYGTEKLPHRIQAARAYGATEILAAGGGRESEAILEYTGGRGLDVVFEATQENQAVEAAIEAVKPGGRVVLIGIPDDDRTSFKASVARRKGLTLALVRRMKHTYPRAISLVRSGRIDTRSLVTSIHPLEDYEKALGAAIDRAGMKVILQMTNGLA
jgi:L-iditol 2-dehydrogenase